MTWETEDIKALVDEVHAAGLELEVIESVNVHEDIKTGLPTRDEYIQHYIDTIRNLARYGIKVIVYNFMPVFDWLRTDLARVIPEDGSNSLYFDEKDLGEMGPSGNCAQNRRGQPWIYVARLGAGASSTAGDHAEAVRGHDARHPAPSTSSTSWMR